MISAYLDSNILIDYCWETYFKEVEDGKQSVSIKLMEKGFRGEFEIYISTYNIIEVSLHFTNWFLLQKVIKSGFSYQDFRRERSKYDLTTEERK